MPHSQTFLLSWGSRRTSEVPCEVALVSILSLGAGGLGLGLGLRLHISVAGGGSSYHLLRSELADLLHGAGSPVLEGGTVELY